MKGYAYLEGVVTLALDRDACVGCGACAHVCPHQVFRMAGGKSEIVDRDACMECGACALNCPVDAIAVEAGVGCASGLFTEWWRDKFPARRGGPKGGCC